MRATLLERQLRRAPQWHEKSLRNTREALFSVNRAWPFWEETAIFRAINFSAEESVRLLALLLSLSLTSPALAMEGDLTLPDGAFFGALYDRLICESFDEVGVSTPSALTARDVKIEKLLADRMLIQFLVAANFKQDDSTCRYSMILTRARNNALVRTQSKVFAVDGTSDCAQGKDEMDKLFSGRLPYTYTKNPIDFVALKITNPTAVEVCGENASHFRVVFKRVRNNNP